MVGTWKDMISIVNELQDAFSRSRLQMDLHLPQIVVVGGQSAGKSSVLEAFVERDFLPRGSGIVTRCPVILQLRNCREDEESAELQCHDGELRQFSNLDDVKEALQEETDKIAGTNRGISSQPIRIKILSPKVLDFTLVDLPGLTKVPVGDQPADIDEQVEELVDYYVTQENTMILAVSPGNQDLANSDSLKVVRKVDPEGDRTIGVITKLDIMDAGTDARDILENRAYPLKGGFVGVVNRSQKEINDNADMQAMKKKEKEFFKNHSSYRHIAHKQGGDYLQKVLNKKLQDHIAKRLPELKVRMGEKLKELKAELTECGLFKVEEDKLVGMLQLVKDFQERLKNVLEGQSTEIDHHNIEGGALINQKLNITISGMLNEVQLPCKEEICIIITNMHGYRNAVSMPELAFESIMKKLIVQYKEPLNEAVQIIGSLLTGIVEKEAKMLQLTPCLQQEVMFLISKRIEEQEVVTQRALMQFIDAECSFMNTAHPDVSHVKQSKKNRKNMKKKTEAEENGTESDLKSEKRIFDKQGCFTFYVDEEEEFSSTNGNISFLQDTKSKEIRMMVEEDKYDREEQRHYQDCVFDRQLSSDIKFAKEDYKNCTIELTECGFPKTVQAEKYVFQFKSQGASMKLKSVLESAMKEYKGREVDKQTGFLINMAHAYMKVVQNNVRDQTSKYVTLLMIKETIRFFQVELLGNLLKGNVEELMSISEDTENKREMLKVYEEGIRILDKSSVSLKRSL